MFSHSTSNSVRAFVFSTLLAALTFGSVGCGRITRTKQCRALIAQTNPALDEVLALTQGNSAGASSASYIAAAGRYERLAKQLGPMEFATEEMAQYVAEYAAVLKEAADRLRALAAALDANDAASADKANRDLERLGARERSVVARMDSWCQP